MGYLPAPLPRFGSPWCAWSYARPRDGALADILACNDRVHRAVLGNPRDVSVNAQCPPEEWQTYSQRNALRLPANTSRSPAPTALACARSLAPASRHAARKLAPSQTPSPAPECAAANARHALLVIDDRPGCIEHTDFARQRIEGAENEAARALQRGLRLGQQNGAAGRGIHDGVDLARFQGLKLGSPFDEPADPLLERGLCREVGRALRERAAARDSFTIPPRAIRAPPTRCRVSLRLPMTFEAGAGDSLARLGVTMTPSANARRGCSQTSTISSL